MLTYLKENSQLYFIFIIWLLSGMFGGPVVYGVLPLTIILMYRKDLYEELLIGYLFILILSDSSLPMLTFAKNVKNIYIVFLTIIYFARLDFFKGNNTIFKLFIPFAIIASITMLLSIGDSYFFTSVQKTLSFFLTLIVIPGFIEKLFKIHGPDFLRRLFYCILLILLVGIALKYIAPNVAMLNGFRYRGLFGGPNGLGIFCVLFFISFFILINYYKDLFSKQEQVFIFGIILLSLIWSGSRNSLIAVFIFYLFQRFFGLSPFLGFLLFVIFLFVSELISSNAAAIINSLGLGGYFRVQTIEEGSGRYIAWAFAWKQIQHNFFIGRGFAYNEFYMRQHYGALLKLNHQGGVHNSFLTFWFDQGLVGLLIYLRSYVLVFIKSAKKTKYAFPAMFAISFTAFFESWLVGSLSAFAFMGVFIFTILTSDEIKPSEDIALVTD